MIKQFVCVLHSIGANVVVFCLESKFVYLYMASQKGSYATEHLKCPSGTVYVPAWDGSLLNRNTSIKPDF